MGAAKEPGGGRPRRWGRRWRTGSTHILSLCMFITVGPMKSCERGGREKRDTQGEGRRSAHFALLVREPFQQRGHRAAFEHLCPGSRAACQHARARPLPSLLSRRPRPGAHAYLPSPCFLLAAPTVPFVRPPPGRRYPGAPGRPPPGTPPRPPSRRGPFAPARWLQDMC